MSSLSAKFTKAYGADALEMKVLAASPLEIIILLYEGAITALSQAEQAIEASDITRKINRLNKALDIIDGLRAALNHDKGGDISTNLADLYEYMKMRLSMANLKNDPALIVEIRNLLGDLLLAWKEIAGTPKPASLGDNAEPAAHAGGSYGKI